jgi:hypothetical protein
VRNLWKYEYQKITTENKNVTEDEIERRINPEI